MDGKLSRHSLRRPIGVFDSGVGGLTVLAALRRKLPHRDFVYLGDTARVPYGRKPPEMVAEFARGITGFLCGLGVEAVVVACNTASSAALPGLAQHSPVPVWGVIDPGVEAARRITRNRRVGVIGTKGTIGSGAYQRRLEALGLTVWSRACPMLVHVVEEGLADSEEAELLVRHYLEDRPELDTLILGCTHYPLLRAVLARVAGASRNAGGFGGSDRGSGVRRPGHDPRPRPSGTRGPLRDRRSARVRATPPASSGRWRPKSCRLPWTSWRLSPNAQAESLCLEFIHIRKPQQPAQGRGRSFGNRKV